MKDFIKSAGIGAAVASFLFLCVYQSSCKIKPTGIELFEAQDKTPKILEVKTSKENLKVFFTQSVSVETCYAVERMENMSSIENFLSDAQRIKVDFQENLEQDRFVLIFNVEQKTVPGTRYELYCVVKDSNNNTLTFTIPFYGLCDKTAGVILSEVSETYSKKDGISEYIELYVTQDGNLFGLELFTASDGKKFSLPLCEVKKGEYIVVHLRKEDLNCINETGADLNISKAPGSVTGARDLWFSTTGSNLSSTAEIILLKNRFDNTIYDCLMYCKAEYASNPDWKTPSLKAAGDECIAHKLWSQVSLPQHAVYSKERKSTSYLSRTDIPSADYKSSAEVWKATSKSSQSPGKPNY